MGLHTLESHLMAAAVADFFPVARLFVLASECIEYFVIGEQTFDVSSLRSRRVNVGRRLCRGDRNR